MKTENGLIEIDGDRIAVTPDQEHEYTLTTALVAKGYGISESRVRHHKAEHSDELIEGKHWITVENPGVRKAHSGRRQGNPTITLWTKLGVIMLGFFIKSERAKTFRKYAAKLVVADSAPKPVALPDEDAELLKRVESRMDGIGSAELIHRLLKLLGPRGKFASISPDSKKPRTKLVSSYWTSRGALNERAIQFMQMQMEFSGLLLAERAGQMALEGAAK